MASYLTDQQISALGLTGTADQIAQTLADAETAYAWLSDNPWVSDTDATTWAQQQWPAASSADPKAPTAAQRLQAAIALLQKAGRVQAITASFQPTPPA